MVGVVVVAGLVVGVVVVVGVMVVVAVGNSGIPRFRLKISTTHSNIYI